ncbi:hypothetical protein AVEN_30575-1 [Araneus ventricosus]|uniref:Uncharacterized protein n=1 Tax=Araneus ventricosus TaxID=182803 RepID=A0A4Y2EQX7_ARAVE|nr:hypothetical protein AVEN_30575-1 [Araneus ventricosus]
MKVKTRQIIIRDWIVEYGDVPVSTGRMATLSIASPLLQMHSGDYELKQMVRMFGVVQIVSVFFGEHKGIRISGILCVLFVVPRGPSTNLRSRILYLSCGAAVA